MCTILLAIHKSVCTILQVTHAILCFSAAPDTTYISISIYPQMVMILGTAETLDLFFLIKNLLRRRRTLKTNRGDDGVCPNHGTTIYKRVNSDKQNQSRSPMHWAGGEKRQCCTLRHVNGHQSIISLRGGDLTLEPRQTGRVQEAQTCSHPQLLRSEDPIKSVNEVMR